MNKMEIIISRFNEDLKWTTEDIFNEYKYIVYNKETMKTLKNQM